MISYKPNRELCMYVCNAYQKLILTLVLDCVRLLYQTYLCNLAMSNIYNMTVTAPNTQIVGQSLTLECSVTTVRGITSSVDIVWSSGVAYVETVKEVNARHSGGNAVTYTAFYTIRQLRTTDDGRVYQCEVVINTSPPVLSSTNITLDVTGMFLDNKYLTLSILFAVPTPQINILPFGSIVDGVVGSPQEIHCTVSTVSGVELSSVMISWMGPGGDTITDNSRVTISPIISVNNNYISTLEFTYLMEGDEGVYTCDVMILETNASDFIQISDLTS